MLYSDVNPITKYAIDKYNGNNKASKVRVLFYDIEVSTEGRLSSPQAAMNPITAISYKVDGNERYGLLLFDTELYDTLNTTGKNLEYCQFETKFNEDKDVADVYVFNREELLLGKWIDIFNQIDPHVYSGWNNDGYDNIYVYNRIKSVLGVSYANSLSPINVVYKKRKSFKGVDDELVFIVGRSSLDMLKLYKKFIPKQEIEYNLNYISKKILGRGKVEYEGNLDQLKRNNLAKFCEYALIDVELLQSMNNKLQQIRTAVSLCTIGRCNYEDIYYSSIYLDGAILSIAKEQNLVCPNQPQKLKLKLSKTANVGETVLHFDGDLPERMSSVGMLRIYKTKASMFEIKYVSKYQNQLRLLNPLTEQIKCKNDIVGNEIYDIKVGFNGAYIRMDDLGRYEWMYDLDLTSMYPMIAITLNVSPETKLGRILVYDSELNPIVYHYKMLHQPNDYKYTIENTKIVLADWNTLMEFIRTGKSVAVNGVVYRQDIEGIIPKALNRWFDVRAKLKKLRDKCFAEGDMDGYQAYDGDQYDQKILLNTLYGVLALDGWRFNDIDNSEAITTTGQFTITSTAKFANAYYHRTLNTSDDVDYVKYIHTDSIFCEAMPLIEHYYDRNKYEYNDDFVAQKSIEVALKVREYINNMYDVMALKILNVDKHRFSIKQEYVSKAAIWLSRNQYVQWVINEEGKTVNKLDEKGVAIKKSNFPIYFKKCMTELIWDVLKGAGASDINHKMRSMYKELNNVPFIDIAKISSIKEISQYDSTYKRLHEVEHKVAGHVKAAIIYNRLISKYKYNCEKISNGSKIKWVYLKDNPFNIDTLAFKGSDDHPKILQFIELYIDRQKLWQKEFETKILRLYSVMNWNYPNLNIKIENNNDFLL